MKKITLCITALLYSTLTLAHPIKIYKTNPAPKLLINYQVCPLNFALHTFTQCDPFIKNATIPAGQREKTLTVPNSAYYLKILHAYEFDLEGIIHAQGDFPNEEDCKSFQTHPATLDDKNSAEITCLRG